MDGAIRYEVAAGVAVVTVDRPAKRNAMGFGLLADFHAAVARAGADPDALAVVVTGAGGAFCAGTDLSELAGTPPAARSGDRGQDPDATGQGAWSITRCPKPVVAAVDGAAVGMGAELATQCDVRVASTGARFAWNFVHRGLVPDTGAASYLLPRQVGLTAALRLVLSGDFLAAPEALALGFVSAVVEPADLLDAACTEARRLSRGSPLAGRLAKELLYGGLGRTAAEHLRHHREALAACFASEDHREGVAAYLERRDAHFTGR